MTYIILEDTREALRNKIIVLKGINDVCIIKSILVIIIVKELARFIAATYEQLCTMMLNEEFQVTPIAKDAHYECENPHKGASGDQKEWQ